MFLGIGLLIFWVVIVPLILGMFMFREKNILVISDIFKAYISGVTFVFALFEVITVPVTFLNGSLTLVTVMWAVICLLLILCGVYRFLKKGHIKKIDLKKKKEINWWFLGTIMMIVFQVVYITLHMHIDDDDAWDVGTAVTSYVTDTINRIHPYTGEWMGGYPSDYTLAPYPVFFAMLGRLTFIHPAILMHTLMPIILIVLSYMVYYLMAEMLYEDDANSIGCMMFFIALFNLFGNFSIRSVSTFLLFRIWQGKATLCNIFIPYAIYLFVQCIERNNWKNWLELGICVIAATMVSSMGVFLMPVLLISMSLIVAMIHRNIKQIINGIVCIVPCFVQFGIYWVVLR